MKDMKEWLEFLQIWADGKPWDAIKGSVIWTIFCFIFMVLEVFLLSKSRLMIRMIWNLKCRLDMVDYTSQLVLGLAPNLRGGKRTFKGSLLCFTWKSLDPQRNCCYKRKELKLKTPSARGFAYITYHTISYLFRQFVVSIFKCSHLLIRGFIKGLGPNSTIFSAFSIDMYHYVMQNGNAPGGK